MPKRKFKEIDEKRFVEELKGDAIALIEDIVIPAIDKFDDEIEKYILTYFDKSVLNLGMRVAHETIYKYIKAGYHIGR